MSSSPQTPESLSSQTEQQLLSPRTEENFKQQKNTPHSDFIPSDVFKGEAKKTLLKAYNNGQGELSKEEFFVINEKFRLELPVVDEEESCFNNTITKEKFQELVKTGLRKIPLEAEYTHKTQCFDGPRAAHQNTVFYAYRMAQIR